jgi:hypothetical protein
MSFPQIRRLQLQQAFRKMDPGVTLVGRLF